MRWRTWKPWYQKIAKRLELDEQTDVAAAKLLDSLLPEPNLKALAKIIRSKECIVFGAGPSLEVDLKGLEKEGYLKKVLISADGATSAVIHYRNPEVIVTDLDGAVVDQLRAWRKGSWLVVHGHGDNMDRLRKYVPKLSERVVGTTQTKPFGKLFNFGGFTDGDRSVFLAHELGAKKIYLAGMDLGTEIGKYSGRKNRAHKLLKLEICRELLGWLSSELGANIVNLTHNGEPIPHVSKGKVE
ncbi:MAG: 6-hydroxymethylpterin diphosphokinase MptE-like protein [Candidatus Hadarchaeum sp.]|uniref:6-hydroxymethylpterin diphosphokinase MptE-like protein n=1 Tax=Candidatus Hadarchaeum sp. TaxID=2883567 RepID=UPI003D14FEE9